MTDDDVRYRAVQARDPRFDGWFFVGVTSTGIYCRPSCPSVLPNRSNVKFYPTAAAAQRAGFRACKRCRPDAAPGSPEWARRDDAVGRAMQAIADGVVDREGVSGLASRLGYSTRQLGRLLLAEVGAGPLDLARAQRAQTARVLLETTPMPAGEVAFAAGFGSVRQFNETVRSIFGLAPTELRARARAQSFVAERSRAEHRGPTVPSGTATTPVTVRLAFRSPLAGEEIFGFLAARAMPGVEEGGATWYRRALVLAHGLATVTVRAPREGERFLATTFLLEDLRDLTSAVKRVRQLFDLDADPEAVAEVLRRSELLGTAVAARPGLRVPGTVDGEEMAMRAVLGQQVSVAGARALAGRMAAAHGRRLAHADGGVRFAFPTAPTVAGLSPSQLPMPGARGRCLIALADALATGKVDLRPGADRERASDELLALPGIGPWTVSYVRMRALRDPDALPSGDLGLRRALERSGRRGNHRAVEKLAEQWRPYRAYALQYLWSGALDQTSLTNREVL